MKVKLRNTKFKVGDIVAVYDDFGFNPANDVYTIGRVEAIHLYYGTTIGYRPSRGETAPVSLKGKTVYSISGMSTTVDESDILSVEEDDGK